MGRPKPVKRQKARNAEYYDMQRTQDDLYKRSLNHQNFIKLMDIIQCDENIMLAYRNIKRNGGIGLVFWRPARCTCAACPLQAKYPVCRGTT